MHDKRRKVAHGALCHVLLCAFLTVFVVHFSTMQKVRLLPVFGVPLTINGSVKRTVRFSGNAQM